MYVTKADEDVQDVTVIRGTLLQNLVLAVVLFDSSTTYTFIAQTLIHRIGVGLED